MKLIGTAPRKYNNLDTVYSKNIVKNKYRIVVQHVPDTLIRPVVHLFPKSLPARPRVRTKSVAIEPDVDLVFSESLVGNNKCDEGKIRDPAGIVRELELNGWKSLHSFIVSTNSEPGDQLTTLSCTQAQLTQVLFTASSFYLLDNYHSLVPVWVLLYDNCRVLYKVPMFSPKGFSVNVYIDSSARSDISFSAHRYKTTCKHGTDLRSHIEELRVPPHWEVIQFPGSDLEASKVVLDVEFTSNSSQLLSGVICWSMAFNDRYCTCPVPQSHILSYLTSRDGNVHGEV